MKGKAGRGKPGTLHSHPVAREVTGSCRELWRCSGLRVIPNWGRDSGLGLPMSVGRWPLTALWEDRSCGWDASRTGAAARDAALNPPELWGAVGRPWRRSLGRHRSLNVELKRVSPSRFLPARTSTCCTRELSRAGSPGKPASFPTSPLAGGPRVHVNGFQGSCAGHKA